LVLKIFLALGIIYQVFFDATLGGLKAGVGDRQLAFEFPGV
jgi:hypothetical protein